MTLAVTDSGLSIDPDELPALFQPFRRTSQAVASGIEGTGLGLAICREVAEAHGGRLWASSRGLGHGSTFCFALPVRS